MKIKVGFFSIALLAIIAIGLRAAEAEDDGQATNEVSNKASIQTDLERMKRTATQSCEWLRQYLEKIEESEQGDEIPTKVYELLERGCNKAKALTTAVAAQDTQSAKRHFLVATGAMSKVSRWLLQREEKLALAGGDKKLKKRLNKIIKRMVKRVQKLQKRAEKLGLEVDFSLLYSIYDAVVTSMQDKDVEATREHLKELRQEIFRLEDEIAQQQEEVL